MYKESKSEERVENKEVEKSIDTKYQWQSQRVTCNVKNLTDQIEKSYNNYRQK